MFRRPQICPTCHRPLAPRLVVRGPVRQRIVDIVANRPDGITRGELIDVVYAGDVNGGPETPNTISVLIHLANQQLVEQGYRIEAAWRGRGGRYRLVKVVPCTSFTAI
jgi:hypothetical protein